MLFNALGCWLFEMLQACGTEGAHDTYCLDDCSGYEGLVPETDEFEYRYYLVSEQIVVLRLSWAVGTIAL